MKAQTEKLIPIIKQYDPTASVVRLGRIGIAIGEAQVIRFGMAIDIRKEVDQRSKIPESLRKWCPDQFAVHEQDDLSFLCEAKLPLAADLNVTLQQWHDDRAPLWESHLWEGTISDALKRVRPYKPIDFSKWSAMLKALKKDGVTIPTSVQARTLRKLCQKTLTLTWHLGWVHGALTRRRIREDAFLSWHQARPDGLRGEDMAPFCEPDPKTPADVLIHVIKAIWETHPHRAATALSLLVSSVKHPPKQVHQCIVEMSAHPGINGPTLHRILGCGIGSQPIWRAARAKYRARNLKLGGVDIQVQTDETVPSNRDDDFFLARNRSVKDLFSRAAQGIQLDEEGRYSLTPERHAKTIARWFLGCDSVLDACCGCGGNAISFAQSGLQVDAVDNNAKRLAMARHNAKIYGVEAQIDFVCGPFMAQTSSANSIFLDPPWSLPAEQIVSWWAWAEQRFAHGAVKLPKNFSVPIHRKISVFCTTEDFPSFIVVSWGSVLAVSMKEGF